MTDPWLKKIALVGEGGAVCVGEFPHEVDFLPVAVVFDGQVYVLHFGNRCPCLGATPECETCKVIKAILEDKPLRDGQ